MRPRSRLLPAPLAPEPTSTTAPEPTNTVAPEPTAVDTVAPEATSTTAPEPTNTTASDPTSVITGPPTIKSDLEDYPPGGRVTLTGTKWQPGETVHITVNDDWGSTWKRDVDVVANADGEITDAFNLPDWFVADVLRLCYRSAIGRSSHDLYRRQPGIAPGCSEGMANLTVLYQEFNNLTCTPPGTAQPAKVIASSNGAVTIGIANNRSVRLGTVTTTTSGII